MSAGSGGEGGPSIASRLTRFRQRHWWLDHLVRAGERYTEQHGDHYAGAITFFTVLSIVPLVMIAFAVAGFVLAQNPQLLAELRAAIGANLPAGLADTLDPILDQAINARTTVGVIGLLFALYAGIGWMTNLREALSEQWRRRREPPGLVRQVLSDLLALAGLGVALAATFAITGLASGFARDVLALLGLADTGWANVALTVLGVLLSLLANWLIFLWVIAKLPREPVAWRSAGQAALLGAVGFELLTQGMTIYLGVITRTPTGAVFGSALGLLLFVYFGSRLLLFVTAWAATAKENSQLGAAAAAPAPAPAVIRPEVIVRSGPDGRTAVGLVGAGALLGGLMSSVLSGRRRDGSSRRSRSRVQSSRAGGASRLTGR